ncbi:MAG TPA: CPXCG motif-containing cysteine-rich protein [Myxococcaceae bacterium]|nr:CPXCG motif-containing cysteine-rich protein [Myxococcaceae bacterium]
MDLYGDSVPESCPYCGEPVEVQVEPLGASEETYVEDCPVCCRPWDVRVSRDGESVSVTLERSDA